MVACKLEIRSQLRKERQNCNGFTHAIGVEQLNDTMAGTV